MIHALVVKCKRNAPNAENSWPYKRETGRKIETSHRYVVSLKRTRNKQLLCPADMTKHFDETMLHRLPKYENNIEKRYDCQERVCLIDIAKNVHV